jgi:hypothetical protein
MDKVLTRKLFRDRYFQSLKPKVKHFQKGGLSSLTPKEKAIYASTLAAPLLQAKGEGIGPALSALGEGVAKLPSTILAVEKAKGSGKGLRTLSESELKAYKLPTGTVAQIDGDGKITVVSKPSAEQMKELRGYKRTRGLLSDIAKDYIDLDKPVGPGDLNRIRGFLGKAAGTNYAKKYAGFKTKIDQATIFLTKAVSGAQVTDQERERIKELIPQVGDTERVFEAKLESLEKYLSAAQNISEETGGDITSAIEILEKNGGVSQFVDFSAPIKYVVSDDVVDLTQN